VMFFRQIKPMIAAIKAWANATTNAKTKTAEGVRFIFRTLCSQQTDKTIDRNQ
jgi:hypothetical protein